MDGRDREPPDQRFLAAFYVARNSRRSNPYAQADGRTEEATQSASTAAAAGVVRSGEPSCRSATIADDVVHEKLPKRLALPRDDGKRRRRLEQRCERLTLLFTWGDLTEVEHRRQEAEVERDLTMLPDDDKLVLYDRHPRLVASMAENVAAATPEQLSRSS